MSLTPEQSADVIRSYHDGENTEFRRAGWKDKVPLGRSAFHASYGEYSILPDGSPLLTFREAKEGLEAIEAEEKSPWPIQPTDEQWQEIERVADTRPCPLDEAYSQVMVVRPRPWQR